MSAREEMLARVRGALGGAVDNQADDYAAIPRGYGQSASLPNEERIHLFIDRLHDYGAAVHRTAERDIRDTIAGILAERSKRTMAVPTDFPDAWLPQGMDFRRDHHLSYAELDQMDGVMTGCAGAIALTGTIVLDAGAAQGRRALTLIPDYHLCVVREEQIVETVPEAVRRMGGAGHAAITFISGPSATSDIEMTRIKGVHGPRTLEIICLV